MYILAAYFEKVKRGDAFFALSCGSSGNRSAGAAVWRAAVLACNRILRFVYGHPNVLSIHGFQHLR